MEGIRLFLEENKLNHLFPSFEEQNMDSLDILMNMTNEELKEFVPLLGDRLKLKKSIENHIIRENSINIGDSVEEIDSDILIDSLPGTSGASSDSTFSSSKSTISDRSITIESALKVADFDSVAKLDILEILNENIIGKAVVLKANKSLPLNSKDRNTICEIIVTHFLNRGLKLNNVYLSILSDKITLAFPSEKRSSYYISPIPKRQSLRNKPEIARGKLIDKHRNKLSAIRKSLNLGNESDPTEAKGLPDIPNQVRDSKLWLRNNIEPEDEVIAAWNSSYCLRSDNKTPTIAEYFSEWPILRTQMAPKLVTIDFERKFVDNTLNLDEAFETFFEKVLYHREGQISATDQTYQSLLSSELTTDSKNTLKLYLTTCMIPPRGRTRIGKNHWKPSAVECRDSFFQHIKAPGDLDTVKKNRVDFTYKKGISLQPYMVVVGPTLNNINSSYVIIDNVEYKLNSVLSALDFCFKSFHVLDAKYPIESSHLWYLIQRNIYGLITPSDVIITYLNDLIQ